ncbi:DNA-3-methyladenine glycosylase I [Desulfovibrio sp. Fe33]|uniref:DNA-3-methyladenine glycosylase I n=1 Tax=Desulfovibrio sp. Fe33 TaxID=3020842 RepID=UPI00234C0624|nr:DNA-3-methyladenine glycosylase I [Desulfovibrio sp. Fe33]
MADFATYCDLCAAREADDLDRIYHDTRYGFPVEDDNELFALLILEINQAGLSWRTILNKESNFRKAFDGFDISTVAAYGESDRTRLLADAGIIRNRLKVDAAIHNAKAVLGLQREHGSFKAWLDAHHPLDKQDWVKLFKTRFKFVGGEIVGEFLMSSGYLRGAHAESCPVHRKILKAGPPWATIPRG